MPKQYTVLKLKNIAFFYQNIDQANEQDFQREFVDNNIL